jgi:hypothetical protein
MSFPRFSLKQLLLSVLWISIGFGGIVFSLRDWNLSLRQSDDWLAHIQPVVRMAGRVIGWTFFCIGVIGLITARQRAKVLILALCGVIPGAIVGELVRNTIFPVGPTSSGYERNTENVIPWLGMALGSIVFLIGGAIAAHWKRRQENRPD